MDKKDWFSTEKLKGISKNHLLIGGLVGVLLLVIAMPIDQGEQERREAGKAAEAAGEGTDRGGISGLYEKELERRLKLLLEEMEGVGKAEVMITLQDEGERVVEKDLAQDSQTVSEKEGEASRSTQEKQYRIFPGGRKRRGSLCGQGSDAEGGGGFSRGPRRRGSEGGKKYF